MDLMEDLMDSEKDFSNVIERLTFLMEYPEGAKILASKKHLIKVIASKMKSATENRY